VKAHRDDRVFLVRMWREKDKAGDGGWRGSVHDVGIGRRFYFTSPGDITDFITVALRDPLATDASRKPI
jgi:hypothetical protein